MKMNKLLKGFEKELKPMIATFERRIKMRERLRCTEAIKKWRDEHTSNNELSLDFNRGWRQAADEIYNIFMEEEI